MPGQVLARLGDPKSLDATDAAPVALERSPGVPAAQDGLAVPLTRLPRNASGTVAGVRVGGRGGISTFALRRLEAACVWVWPDAQS